MARLFGPLFSVDARGKLGNALVYSNWKGLATVRMFAVPYNPQLPGQVAQRLAFANAVGGWQKILEATRALWNAYAIGISTAVRPLSGFNAFVSAYIAAADYPEDPCIKA